jgi:hypothetical protein
MNARTLLAAVAAALFLFPAGSHAVDPTDRPPDKGGFTRAMGIPSHWRATVGLEYQAYKPSSDLQNGGLIDAGIMRHIGNPMVGIAALGVEGYFGGRSNDADLGVRAYFTVPSLLIGGGVDYNAKSEESDFILKLDIPVRRRGIVGAGSAMTFRWLPTRDQTFTIGLTLPIGDRDAGLTRPQSDYVKMDSREPERLEAARLANVDSTLFQVLDILHERARWVQELTQPFAEYGGSDAAEAMAPRIKELRDHMAAKDALFPNGHTVNEEIRVYHETLDRAFSIAESGGPVAPGHSTEMGRRISVQARRILLDDVIFPYDYLHGQLKKKDTLSGLIAVAQTDAARALLSSKTLDDEQARRVVFVFQSLCDAMEENRERLSKRWGDNRYVWLPLQYGLTPDEHDTQTELDAIIARATQLPFTPANRTWYIINEEFQYEMARSVRLAEDYHVLWVHDMSGVNHNGEPDAIAYEQVKNYLLAFTERVRAYDDTGKLPMYFVFLDQLYFEANKSSLWMALLEDPMHHKVDLPKKFAAWEAEISGLQGDLRNAVEGSLMLQVEKSQYGEKWLNNRIRVQVNITNPADFSFYSMKIIGKMPIPDNQMRDHRKIVFYDVSEDDPYRGMTMFTGMGIGEHYTGSTWEDRALMLQGPAALATKNAARELLKTQGFTDEQIPFPFRPRPKGAGYDEAITREAASLPDYVSGSVIELHNDTGFTPKQLSVGKCVLYSLMPPGSVMYVPDSLWQSYVYASLMAGSALRGCCSLVISPSLRAAPSSGTPQMTRASGLMKRLVVFGNEMDDYMEREGGILRVGIYAPRHGVGDLAGRIRQAMSLDLPWADRVYHFSPKLGDVAAEAPRYLDEAGYKPEYLTAKDSLESPKLHLKVNFFASAQVWNDLMSRPEWAGVFKEYTLYLARQQGAPPDSMRNVREVPEALAQEVKTLLDNYFSALPPEQRATMISYLTIGSSNMDYRSQMLNGEVMLVQSGVRSLAGVLDFVVLGGQCAWPETPEQVDALIPPPGWFWRKISAFVKVAI